MLARMLPTYSPSGKTGPLALVAVVALAPVGAAAAWLYQFLIELIPLIYLDALLVVGFAFALAMLTHFGLRATKCRSRSVSIIAGLTVAASAVAASHAFAYLNLHHAAAKALGHDVDHLPVAKYLEVRMDMGWSIGRGGGGLPIKGPFVWVMWVIEALGLLVGGVLGGLSIADTPFCEACGQWADKDEIGVRVPRPSGEALARVKGASQAAHVLDVTPGQGTVDDELKYTLRRCPTCTALPTLSVDHTRTVLKGKKAEKKTESLHKHVLLSPEEAQGVRDMAKDFETLAAPGAAKPV